MNKLNGQPDPSSIHSYEVHKPEILRIFRKLMLKDQVASDEWQDLFHHVHMVCSWDATGIHRLIRCIEREFHSSYISPLKSRLKSIDDGHQQLKEYINHWADFRNHCVRIPMAFQQLDLATRDALLKGKYRSSITACSSPPYSAETNKSGPAKCKLLNNNVAKSSQQQYENSDSPQALVIDLKNKHQYSLVRCILVRLWADKILNPNINRLLNSVRELLMQERCGLLVDTALITGLRQSLAYLEELRIVNYHQNHMKRFEKMYIEAIELFYSPISDEYLRVNGVTRYISWALNKFEIEEVKALQYLETNSEAFHKVNDACNNALVKNFVEQITKTSRDYIQSGHIESMQLVFKFFSKLDGLVENFLQEMCSYFISYGIGALRNLDPSSKPDSYVEKLLEVHSDLDAIVRGVFGDDLRAYLMLENALGSIINDSRPFRNFNLGGNNIIENSVSINSSNMIHVPGNKFDQELRCAESLAFYCNLLFRKSPLSRKLSNEEFTKRLDQLYMIIKLLKNKEAFTKCHKTYLVKRLIPDATINLDREEWFINRLKDLVGIPLEEVNEILRMFKDLKTSEMLASKFLKVVKPTLGIENVNNNNTISNISTQITDRLCLQDSNSQLNVKVLNPSAWSKNLDKSKINLPEEIVMIMPVYEAFYMGQYEGRELEWCHHLSNGIITFTNSNGNKYELEVTAAQLSILHSFNEQPHSLKTFNEFKLLSNLSVNELRRTIWVSSRE